MNIEELIQFQQQSTQLIREKLHPMQLPDYIKELIVQSAQQIFRSFYFDSVATLAPAETTTTAERRHEVSKLGGEKLGALRNRDEPNVEHTKPLGSTSFENVDVSYGDAFSGLEYGVALNHEAFEWLLSRLDREIQPASTAETINDIGHAIETHLPLSDFSNDFHGFSFVADHHATFTIHCDTYSFWQSQLIDSSKTKTLSNLITITGSSQDAQALTCGQYLSQTWPITGPQVLGRLNLIFTMDTKFSRESNQPLSELTNQHYILT